MMSVIEDVGERQDIISHILFFVRKGYKKSTSQEIDDYVIGKIQLMTSVELNELIKWKNEETGEALLHTFAAYNLIKSSEFLLQQGADCNVKDSYGATPLHYAASYANYGVVKLYDKADLNAQDQEGDTPLHAVLHDQL